MPNELASVVKTTSVYGRLRHLASQAGISLYALAHEADIEPAVLYQMKTREEKGIQKQWSNETLNKISQVLAAHLHKRPSEVYAHLTGLEETTLASK